MELAPQLPLARAVLAKTLFQQGAYAETIREAAALPAPHPPDVIAVVGLAHLRSGDQSRAAAILKELEGRKPVPSAALAQWHAVTGDVARGIRLLEQHRGDVFAPAAEVDPLFDGLRKDARFSPLARGGR